MYTDILLYFLYYNLQFIFDSLYKNTQIEFLENQTLYLFCMFNFYNFIVLLLHLNEKTFRIKYLENPIKKIVFKNTTKKITSMSKLWSEENSISNIITSNQEYIYNKSFETIELYGAVMRTIINSYIIYRLYDYSLQILIPFYLFYISYYYFILENNRSIIDNNNKKINQYNEINSHLYSNYFNSCMGSYEHKYLDIINDNYSKINDYNLKNENIDKYYLGILQITQKVLVFLFMAFSMFKNNKNSLLLIPLYQTTITLVYQFEYILHNLNCIMKKDNTVYNKFIDDYNNENKIEKKHIENQKFIDYNLCYKNKNSILIHQNFDISRSNKILIEGKTGIGKSSLCKILSGYFKDYNHKSQNRTLYITQNIYLYTYNRTLYNVITDNDLNLFENRPALFDFIIRNVIPFDDILNSFEGNYKNHILTNKCFSGGQEKRIYLAKWLYYLLLHNDKYDILILDEPDKSLDKDTFTKLLNNLLNNNLFKTFKIIIVSHNIDNKNLFDSVFYIDKKNNNLEIQLTT